MCLKKRTISKCSPTRTIYLPANHYSYVVMGNSTNLFVTLAFLCAVRPTLSCPLNRIGVLEWIWIYGICTYDCLWLCLHMRASIMPSLCREQCTGYCLWRGLPFRFDSYGSPKSKAFKHTLLSSLPWIKKLMKHRRTRVSKISEKTIMHMVSGSRKPMTILSFFSRSEANCFVYNNCKISYAKDKS